MEFQEILQKRRMVRNFEDRPVHPAVVERVLDAGLRSPSAGFTQGVELLVLSGRVEADRYWDAALPAERRPEFPWPGLLLAPLLIVVLASEDAYRRRYAEPDKAGSDVTVPWWIVDAAFTALLLQLAAVDAGLGALFFEAHRVPALRQAFAIPHAFAPIGTVAVGHPAPDRPSSSVAARPRRPPAETVHRGRW